LPAWYLAQVLSKAFLLTTLLLPLFMGMIMGRSILAATLIGGDKHLVVASDDATLAGGEDGTGSEGSQARGGYRFQRPRQS
jgi:hypothetical protein